MTEFDLIDATCTRRAWALACALTGNAADADDVMQQAFIVAWRRVKDIPAEPWAWMATVVANCARNHGRSRARKRKREAAFVNAAPAQHTEPASSLEQQELQSLLMRALDGLPEAEREAIVLCHISGLTQQQASEAIGINLNTLKARSSRGMAHLREKLAASAAALEGYLATVAFVPPPGGFEAAATRWKEGAVTPVTPPPAGSPFAAFAGVGAAVAVCVILVVAWILTDDTAAAAKHEFAALSILDNAPIVASAPAASPLLGAGSDTGFLADPSTDATLVANLEAPVASDETPVSRTDDPTGAGDMPRLVHRLSTYDTGEKWMEWTELVLPTGSGKHGMFTQYYRTGPVEECGEFVNNRRHGVWSSYFEDGGLHSRGQWANDAQQGVWEYYNEFGVKTREFPFVDGKRVGRCTHWHPNGQLKKVYSFVDGHIEGLATEYDTDGNKRLEVTWKAGRKDGPQYEYDKFGNVIATSINVPQPKSADVDTDPQD